MSSAKIKFKPRQAPSPEALQAQQLSANKMLSLQDLTPWVSEANYTSAVEPPVAPPTPVSRPEPEPAPTPISVAQAPVAPAFQAQPMPWDLDAPEAPHAYNLMLSERLFQQLSWSARQKGFRSLRAFVTQTLQNTAEKIIKDAGK